MPISPDQMAALHRRDPAVLHEVASQHARRLYRAARGMGHPAEDADDLVQDVFVTFIATLDRFEGRAEVHTWLFGILLRKSQERRRKRARDEQHDPIDDEWADNFNEAGSWVRPPLDPGDALEAKQVGLAIEDCLPGLSDSQREVFYLRMVEALSAAEVGKVLGLTVTHIGVLLHRARLRMRDCLGRKGWKAGAS